MSQDDFRWKIINFQGFEFTQRVCVWLETKELNDLF